MFLGLSFLGNKKKSEKRTKDKKRYVPCSRKGFLQHVPFQCWQGPNTIKGSDSDSDLYGLSMWRKKMEWYQKLAKIPIVLGFFLLPIQANTNVIFCLHVLNPPKKYELSRPFFLLSNQVKQGKIIKLKKNYSATTILFLYIWHISPLHPLKICM